MRNHLLVFVAAMLLLSSCQKVIHVDLNSANPQFVIEGNLYEGTHDFKVHITKTTSYFSTDSAPAVKGAVVTLNDAVHPVQNLTDNGNGWYSLNNYTATHNTDYTLHVSAEGQDFTASSHLPVSPVFDSLTFKKFGGGFGGANIDPYIMTAHFQDSAGIANYYRIIVTKNDSVQNGVFDLYLLDDVIRDGQYFDAPVFSAFCDIGDSMTVELLSMDKPVYDYFSTLQQLLGNDANNSAAPSNPNSNWSNHALGYFGAFATQRKYIIIH